MKILFSSYAFSPGVGRIESVSALLAREFAGAGDEVIVVTETPGQPTSEEGYQIIRHPSLGKIVSLLRRSDLLFQNNISLPVLIPALLLKKKALVVHQTWIRSPGGELGWKDRLKRALLPRVQNVAISQAVADDIKVGAPVIGNPYRDDMFRVLPNVARDKSLVFLGRFVSDKGVDVLLHALKILQRDGLKPDLTIIGTGPEEQSLRDLTRELELDQQVTFTGKKDGYELVQLLNRHRILVVPSRWAEPFGVVALEAIACGCVVVGSDGGGLKEAIGPCGVVFSNESAHALADSLRYFLDHAGIEAKLQQSAPAHLARFTSKAVAVVYLDLMQRMLA